MWLKRLKCQCLLLCVDRKLCVSVRFVVISSSASVCRVVDFANFHVYENHLQQYIHLLCNSGIYDGRKALNSNCGCSLADNRNIIRLWKRSVCFVITSENICTCIGQTIFYFDVPVTPPRVGLGSAIKDLTKELISSAAPAHNALGFYGREIGIACTHVLVHTVFFHPKCVLSGKCH